MSRHTKDAERDHDEASNGDACPECLGYLDRRSRKIAGPMAQAAQERGMSVRDVAEEFMAGVHARHLAGLPI